MTLSSDVSLVVSALLTQSEDVNSTLRAPVDLNLLRKLSTDEADLLWYKTVTLAGGADTTMDLTSGLTDAFGNGIVFDKVKIIAVVADTTNTDNILVGGGTFDTWLDGGTDAVVVQPGGAFVVVAPNTGYQVTAVTGNELLIENASPTDPNSYNILLIGSSL